MDWIFYFANISKWNVGNESVADNMIPDVITLSGVHCKQKTCASQPKLSNRSQTLRR